ncbi:unnamed protein product, partial [Urochloa humidicola]
NTGKIYRLRPGIRPTSPQAWISSRRQERQRSSCAGGGNAAARFRDDGDGDERLLPPVAVLLAGDLFSYDPFSPPT